MVHDSFDMLISNSDKLTLLKVIDSKVCEKNQKDECKGFTHATIVTKIIEQYGRYDKLDHIEILNQEGLGNIVNLIVALKWCISQDVDIINLSLGTTCKEDFEELGIVCEQLINQGKIIIAAEHNLGYYSMPSSLNKVISVKSIRIPFFCIWDKKNNRMLTNGKIWITTKDNGHIKTQSFNSYACAYITSLISKKGTGVYCGKNKNRRGFQVFWNGRK